MASEISFSVTDGMQTAPVSLPSTTTGVDLVKLIIGVFDHATHQPEHVYLKLDGRDLFNEPADRNKSLEQLGITEGQLVLYVYQKPAAAPTQQAPSTSNPAANREAMGALLGLLASGIKVPRQKGAQSEADKQKAATAKDETRIKELFDSLAQSTARVELLEVDHPELAAAYKKDPTDFQAFLKAYHDAVANERRLAALANDPSSAEGQRYLEKIIARRNIDHNYERAMNETPQFFFSVHMLYVKLKINGQDVFGFVDSGAQVTIMSIKCARRCNVERLIDRRYIGQAMGVGGSQKFIGRVHTCDVHVGDTSAVIQCSFTVLDDTMDLLIGLDTLRAHACTIDLKRNALTFGEGCEAPFLTQVECEQNGLNSGSARRADGSDQAGGSGSDGAAAGGSKSQQADTKVDAAKLANLQSMGFSAELARRALLQTDGDLEAAVQLLIAAMATD